MTRISIASLLAVTAMSLTGCTLFGRQAASAPARPIVTTTPAARPGAPVSDILGGEWTITAAGATPIKLDEGMPYINFVPEEGRFYAFNGCNVLNGSYKAEGNTITFSHVASTMKYCPDIKFDTQINMAIADSVPVKAVTKQNGNTTVMYITDRAGRALLTMTRHNLQFLNGNWQVMEINGKKIDDEEANIFFDIAELKVHGNTGCNYFNGNILIDPQSAGTISLSGMGVTRMACPKADQERTMLVALEETVKAVRVNAETVNLLDSAGKKVITLKRIAVEPDNE